MTDQIKNPAERLFKFLDSKLSIGCSCCKISFPKNVVTGKTKPILGVNYGSSYPVPSKV